MFQIGFPVAGTIHGVKRQIFEASGIFIEKQDIYVNNHLTKDGDVVSQYDFSDGDVIQLEIRADYPQTHATYHTPKLAADSDDDKSPNDKTDSTLNNHDGINQHSESFIVSSSNTDNTYAQHMKLYVYENI